MTKLNIEVNKNETKNDDRRVQENKYQLTDPLDETERDTNLTELGMMNKNEKTDAKTNKNGLFCQCPNDFIKYKNVKRYWKSILIRLMFLGIPCFHINLVSCIYSNSLFFILYAYIIVILLDGLYVLVKRHGNEHHWFSISFAAYIIVMIIVIIYTMNYKHEKDDVACETNATHLNYIKSCGESMQNLSICTLVEISIVGFLATLVVGRWIMPHSKRLDKEAKYFQVYSFTTLSADLIEISQLMQDEHIAHHYSYLKACEAVFAISLLQFSFSLAAVKQRNMKLTGIRRGIDIFFATEAWAEALCLISQELPCFILRLVLIISIVPDDYILYFYALKNGLMSCLLIGRIIALCWEQNKVQPSQD